MRRLREFWLGEADTAPLRLFRVLYGLQLFNWSWQLYPNLNAFFTDEGILPRREQLVTFADRFTLLNLFGEWWQVALVWAASCAVALLLTIGWRTRLMSLLAFVFVSSFSWRDPLILDGSDFVFRMVALWLAFAPTGRRGWALPIRILELQIAWIYLASGIEKLGGTQWLDGTAAYYALQLEHTFGRGWAHAIATNTLLAHLISWSTLAVELAFLPLVVIPSRITRLVAVAGAAGMHLGILLLMNVGNFPVIMLSALVLFLPAGWIHRALGGLAPPPAPAIRRSRVAGVALAVAAALAFATAVPSSLEPLRPSGDLATLLRFLSVDQRWDMFSPDPAHSDGWMLAPARLADGTTFDLFTGGSATDRSERYSDPLYSRWVKVHERIASVGYAGYRSEYARHFCRTRNLHPRPGQAPLATFELIYVERVIQAPEKGPPQITEIPLWTHRC